MRVALAILLPLLLPVMLPVMPAAMAQGEVQATPAQAAPTFARFVQAWKKGSADGVAALIDKEGTARFTLLEYPLEGATRTMKPAQARVSLKEYFHDLSDIVLKDVTPRKGPDSVRHLEFTYRPSKHNRRTTRLHVQLKRDRNGPWVLASVTESAMPRDD
jgi:hypothetical protein